MTDLEENSRVVLPKPASDALESEMEVIRETIMREFKKYKKEVEEKIIKEATEKEKRKKNTKLDERKIETSEKKRKRDVEQKEKE